MNRNRHSTPSIIRSVACVVTAFIIQSCSGFPPEPTPPDPVTVISSSVATLEGRPFSLDVLAATLRGKDYQVLQIIGDGMVVSFHSSTGPLVVSVSGAVVSYGGHTFSATAIANEYLVDGQAHTFEPNSNYMLSDGVVYRRLR